MKSARLWSALDTTQPEAYGRLVRALLLSAAAWAKWLVCKDPKSTAT
jgi:hypothetical protein